jgi:hypothetical protein
MNDLLNKHIEDIKNYNKHYNLSDKQKNYIEQNMTNEEIKNIIQTDNLNNITSKNVKTLFSYIQKHKYATNNQIKLLQMININLDDISKFLKREIKNFEELTAYDINKLLNKNPEINLKNALKKINPSRDCIIYEWDDGYEYGLQKIDSKNSMVYMKFYDLLVIDYDHKDLETLQLSLNQTTLLLGNDVLYRIYETYKGYHIILVSHLCPYNSDLTMQLSYILNSDRWYMLFSRKHGYCIRLSCKKDRNETQTHKLIGTFGSGKMIPLAEKCIEKFENKFNKIPEYKNNISNNFYQTFINNITNNREKPEKVYNEEYIEDYILDNFGLNYESVVSISEKYRMSLRKPQRCICSKENFYIGIDMNTNIYYLCMKNVMMIDIDYDKSNTIKNKEDVLDMCQNLHKTDNLNFSLYSSTNGMHIFITNKYFNYNDKKTIELMIKMDSDKKYIYFSYLRGFCVRVNPKNLQDKPYQHIKDFGDQFDNINYFINLHLQLYDNFSNIYSYIYT